VTKHNHVPDAAGQFNTQIAELVGSNRHTVARVLAEPAAGANVGPAAWHADAAA
jgi:hypothetical protein